MPEPFGPPRMVHVNSGMKRLLPYRSRSAILDMLTSRPILGFVLPILGRDRQTHATAFGQRFPADLLERFLVFPILPQQHLQSPIRYQHNATGRRLQISLVPGSARKQHRLQQVAGDGF
ncbi:hypothetical protein [Rhizobium ecuadorense]|uniref:hypothetical protein n=1 Tax=Rhizobium ecuadorense TaxID=1671795 RepID=UPI001428A5FC|nr:hypothetical protein [Rhizobium ecuadorense]